MKRLALTLVAGAFGTLMALPIAQAQVMNPNNDAGSVPGDRTYNQASKETVEDYQNSAPGAATTSEQVDVQKRSENVENGDLGATTQKQVDVQKRSENVQNDALGTDTTQKQVDIQKSTDSQNGAFGPTTHEQVDVQKRSESVNNSMNDSTPNSAPDANQ
jgi:hypothetical protein